MADSCAFDKERHEAPAEGSKSGALVSELSRAFRDAGIESAQRDARMLVREALGRDDATIIAHSEDPVSPEDAARVYALARRRIAREPVSRILGRRAFWTFDLVISPATLDPRPESETIIETVLELLRRGVGRCPPNGISIADIGTGSGALALALLTELTSARCLATELSEPALAIAQLNARRLGLANRIDFVQSNWLDGVRNAQLFDLIVANPPYIERDAIAQLAPEVCDFEPRLALDGGADGLAAYRSLIPQASERLHCGGLLALEIGAGQGPAVRRIASSRGLIPVAKSEHVVRDLAGHERVVVAFKPQSGFNGGTLDGNSHQQS